MQSSSETADGKDDQNDRADPQKEAAYWRGQCSKQPYAKTYSHEQLKLAVEQKVGGIGRHVESTRIKEMFRGDVVWEGIVETFDLFLNPQAKRCYAWSYEEGGEIQYVTVLHIPPVDSPESAVKAAIAGKTRPN